MKSAEKNLNICHRKLAKTTTIYTAIDVGKFQELDAPNQQQETGFVRAITSNKLTNCIKVLGLQRSVEDTMYMFVN